MTTTEQLDIKVWKEGYKEGFKEAWKEGLQFDRNERRRTQIIKFAYNCLALGLDRAMIARATGLSSTEIDYLTDSLQKGHHKFI
jgi:predicted transposase YdaD